MALVHGSTIKNIHRRSYWASWLRITSWITKNGYENLLTQTHQELDLVNANVVDQMLDNTALKTMGWKSKVSLQEGLQTSYHWFLQNIA